MRQAMIRTMTEAEQRLIAETERAVLQELDEDDLLDLHGRIRRARNKYVKLYRRQAGARVRDVGGRGFARPQGQRDRDKAEVFEDALARVSRQVATVARRAAAELRAERLAAARGTGGSGPSPEPPAPATVTEGRALTHRKTTGGLKKDASSRAAGARRQARRDG